MALAPPPAPPAAPRLTAAPDGGAVLDLVPVTVPKVRPAGPDRLAPLALVMAIVLAMTGIVAAVAKRDQGPEPVASAGAPTIIDDRDRDEPPAEDPSDADEAPADVLAVPAGYHVVQGDGIYLAVPESWISLSPSTAGDILDDDVMEELYPDVDPMMREMIQSTARDGAILFAMDREGLGSNLNVLAVPGEAPLGLLVSQVERELERSGLDVDFGGTEEVELPLGDAVRITYTMQVGNLEVDIVQYMVPADGTTYIVTGTDSGDVVQRAAETLRLGEAPTPS